MGLLLQAVGLIVYGCYLIKAGFSKKMRQARIDREDARPVFRPDRVDRIVRAACFVLGAACFIVGLFLLVNVIAEWLYVR